MSSTVQTRHPEYSDSEYERRQCRDTVGGTSKVKRSGDLYLPIPAAMLMSGTKEASVVSDNGDTNTNTAYKQTQLKERAPWKHSVPAYSNYLQRARFPDITNSILMGLVGIATQKAPEFELTNGLESLSEKSTADGSSLIDFYKDALTQVLTAGRCEIVVDIIDDEPKLLLHTGESLINWRTQKNDGCEQATLNVYESFENDATDQFAYTQQEVHYVLQLSTLDEESQIYTTDKYVNGMKVDETIVPNYRGTPLDYIPSVVINPSDIGYVCEKPPILGVSDIAISIYQKDADLSNAEFLTCNPMLYVTGVNDGQNHSIVGSNMMIELPLPESTVGYAEPAGTSLGHVEQRIQSLMIEAGHYGLMMLGQNGAEAAETTRMKQEASGASLKTVVKTVGQGIEQALKIAADWIGDNTDDVKFEPNLQFSEIRLTAQEQVALLNAWTQGGISTETYHKNLKQGGIIQDEDEASDEVTRISQQPPSMATPVEPEVGNTEDQGEGDE